jgi:hypothetical protein
MAGSNLTSRVQSGQYQRSERDECHGLLAVNTIKENWEINPSFGGPIQKDKVWFYYSARYQRAQNYAAGMYQNANGFTSLSTPSNFQYVPVTAAQGLATDGKWDDSQLRVTWQASPKNKFTGMWDTQSHGVQCQTPSPQRPRPSRPRSALPEPELPPFRIFLPITSKVLIEFVGLHRQERWGNMELRPSSQSPCGRPSAARSIPTSPCLSTRRTSAASRDREWHDQRPASEPHLWRAGRHRHGQDRSA